VKATAARARIESFIVSCVLSLNVGLLSEAVILRTNIAVDGNSRKC
jgi:hypothetical protein